MLTRKSTKEQLRRAKLSNALNNSVIIVTGASSLSERTDGSHARRSASTCVVHGTGTSTSTACGPQAEPGQRW